MLETNKEKILAIAKRIIELPEYQPGYPMWDDRQKLIKAGIDPATKNYPGVTWCQAAACKIMRELGFDMEQILDIEGIGYTTANEMYDHAIAAEQNDIIQGVTAREAQELANEGTVCIVLAPGAKHGHVAVVMPCSHEYNPEHGCFIAQAGSKNGFFYVNEIFTAPWVYPDKIRYMLLNEKVLKKIR